MIEKQIVPFPIHRVNKKRFLERSAARTITDEELNSPDSDLEVEKYFARILLALQVIFSKYTRLHQENKLIIPDNAPKNNNSLGIENTESEVVTAVLELSWMFDIQPLFWINLEDEKPAVADRTKLVLIGIADQLLTIKKNKTASVRQEQSVAQGESNWPYLNPQTKEPVFKLIPFTDEAQREWHSWQIQKKRNLLVAVRLVTMFGSLNLSGTVNARIAEKKSTRKRHRTKIEHFESQFDYTTTDNETVQENKRIRALAFEHKKHEYTADEEEKLREAHAFISKIRERYGFKIPAAPATWITNLGESEFENLMHCSAMASSESVVLPDYNYSRQWLWLLFHEYLHTIFNLTNGFLWGGLNESVIEKTTATPLNYPKQRMAHAILEVLVNRYAARSGMDDFQLTELLTQTSLELSQDNLDSPTQQRLNSLLLQLFGAQGMLTLAMMSNFNSNYSPVILQSLEYPLSAAQGLINAYNRLHQGPQTTMSGNVVDRLGAVKFHQGLREWAQLPTLKGLLESATPLSDVIRMDDVTFAGVLEQEELRMHMIFEKIFVENRKHDESAEYSTRLFNVPDYKIAWVKMLQLWYWRKKRQYIPLDALCNPDTEFEASYMKMVTLTEANSQFAVMTYIHEEPSLYDLTDLNYLLVQYGEQKNLNTNPRSRFWFIDDCLQHLEPIRGEYSVSLYKTLIAQLNTQILCGYTYLMIDQSVEKELARRMVLMEPTEEDENPQEVAATLSEIKFVLRQHAAVFEEFFGDWERVAQKMQKEILPARLAQLKPAIMPLSKSN